MKYTPEHLQAVRDDPQPLEDRLEGNYGIRHFDVPAIQIVAAQEIRRLKRELEKYHSHLDEIEFVKGVGNG